MSGQEPSGREAESRPDGPPSAAGAPEGAERGRELALLPGGSEPIEIVEAELVDAEPESIPAPPLGLPAADGYTPGGVPTLDYVRQRIATSLAAEEVFGQSAPAVSEEARQEELRRAASEKLADLRAELDRDKPDAG
ncbi:MAG: hypothetical protein ACRC20_06675 [Segniliparus sp.]|uniref:hypothetical protein n=1 Tax=Segniliparus sp. TaxID=2804064 RepID=UPI003F3C2728